MGYDFSTVTKCRNHIDEYLDWFWGCDPLWHAGLVDSQAAAYSGDWLNAILFLIGIINGFLRWWEYLYAKDDSSYPPYALPKALRLLDEAGVEPEPITWKDIVKAFGEASDPGKMWIITELDWMRKQLWHKPTRIKWDENPFE